MQTTLFIILPHSCAYLWPLIQYIYTVIISTVSIVQDFISTSALVSFLHLLCLLHLWSHAINVQVTFCLLSILCLMKPNFITVFFFVCFFKDSVYFFRIEIMYHAFLCIKNKMLNWHKYWHNAKKKK